MDNKVWHRDNMDNWYNAEERCHRNAKFGEVYRIEHCVVCGDRYEKKIEKEEEKKDD